MNVEELRRMLAEDLQALRDGKSVLGVGEMADEVEKLGSSFTANALRIRSYENARKLLGAQYAVGWRSSRGRHKRGTDDGGERHQIQRTERIKTGARRTTARACHGPTGRQFE